MQNCGMKRIGIHGFWLGVRGGGFWIVLEVLLDLCGIVVDGILLELGRLDGVIEKMIGNEGDRKHCVRFGQECEEEATMVGYVWMRLNYRRNDQGKA